MKKVIIGLIVSAIAVMSGATSAFAARAYINDLQKVCTWQYSGSTAILIGNSFDSQYLPYSWYCTY